MKLRIASLTFCAWRWPQFPPGRIMTTVPSTAPPMPGPSTSAISSATPYVSDGIDRHWFSFRRLGVPGRHPDFGGLVDHQRGEWRNTLWLWHRQRQQPERHLHFHQPVWLRHRQINVTGLNVSTISGTTYWLNLQNAAVPSGDPVFWDENSGVGCGGTGCPSQASESALGTIPSEAFTITSCGAGNGP